MSFLGSAASRQHLRIFECLVYMGLARPAPRGFAEDFLRGDDMRKTILRALETVQSFVPRVQFRCLVDGLKGEERTFFREKLRYLEYTINTMPVTYEQSELGEDAVIHLHYFMGGADWWITEKDMEGGTQQAFGLADLGHGPELGYISIDELVSIRGMDIDLHWEPKTLAQLKAERSGAQPVAQPEPVAEPEQEESPYAVAQVIDPAAWFAFRAPGLLH